MKRSSKNRAKDMAVFRAAGLYRRYCCCCYCYCRCWSDSCSSWRRCRRWMASSFHGQLRRLLLATETVTTASAKEKLNIHQMLREISFMNTTVSFCYSKLLKGSNRTHRNQNPLKQSLSCYSFFCISIRKIFDGIPFYLSCNLYRVRVWTGQEQTQVQF